MTSPFQRSIDSFQQGQALLPGGVSSPVRRFSEVSTPPIFVERAAGAALFDVDGRRYQDFVLGLGPILLGHSNPIIGDAVSRQMTRGSVFALPTEVEYELASLVLRATPAAERVRFVCSGTEAVMSALRLARGKTGRSKYVKFRGSYHGHADSLLARGEGVAWSPASGVPESVHRDAVVAEYNSVESVEAAFSAHKGEVAAVLVEPFATNMGLVKPERRFFGALRQLCTQSGALLVFDEVVTGFRLQAGSAATLVGVQPDLITYGKIIGGGLPIGAYCGPANLMDALTDKDGVFQGGTFAGNPVSMAAGKAALEQVLQPGFYDRLEALGACVEDAVRTEFERLSISFGFVRQGSICSFVLADSPSFVRSATVADARARRLFSAFHARMALAGHLFAPSIEEPFFLSAAHEPDQLRSMARLAAETLAELRHGGSA
jgi:glutamate-1-semialdehyde 2,1-aminomutase